MSAVIWCGIVAVWVFLLIPTWVRRGDIHWHRGTVGPVGKVAVAEGPDESSSAKSGGRAPGRRLRRRSRDDLSIEVEAMAEQDGQSPAESSYGASAPRARVAAAPSSGRLGSSVRSTFGAGPKGSGSARKKPPLRVRRARRLVVLAALTLGTLIAAIFAGGMLIVINIIFDIALILYIRHLHNDARARSARAAREKRARAARVAWEEASAQERASGLDGWSAPAVEPATEPYQAADVPFVEEDLEYADGEVAYADDEVASQPAEIDLTNLEQPALIDLTDAPTEELAAAQAV
jgi:hypothetical protein